jgi:hypothetical protein
MKPDKRFDVVLGSVRAAYLEVEVMVVMMAMIEVSSAAH